MRNCSFCGLVGTVVSNLHGAFLESTRSFSWIYTELSISAGAAPSEWDDDVFSQENPG
jgi:hypothetical protein